MVISCIIRRIAQIQNVLVAANGKAFDLAKFRVLQLLAQLFSKVGAAGSSFSKIMPRQVTGADLVLSVSS
jgi:hypothetical protein